MREGWKKVKGRGTEHRFQREDNPDIYVRIGASDDISKNELAERIEDAMAAAELAVLPTKPRGEAPPATMRGE